jgi:addiction module HigA family antidote
MNRPDTLAPIYPGEVLKEDFLEPLGISMNQLSRDIDVPANRISEIVNGKRGITADTALRLERYFGVEAGFWLNLQTEFDLRTAKQKIGAEIKKRIVPASRIGRGLSRQAGALPGN